MPPRRTRRARSAATSLLVACAAAALAVAPLPHERIALADDDVIISVTLLQGYSPTTVQIQTGTTVVWRNDEALDVPVVGSSHQVRADDGSFESPVLPRGASWPRTFLEPGTFTYTCVLHPQLMSGEVIASGPKVTEQPKARTVQIVEPDRLEPDGWGYRPQDLTIDTGTTVTWRNNGAETHTVTALDGSFDSGDLGPGESFEFTFDDPVSLRYRCTPHEWMTGTVRAGKAGGKPPPPPARDDPPGPAAEPTQAPRVGDEPATFDVLAVEPGSNPMGWGFAPPALKVRAGDTVVWENAGSAAHTVTARDGSFDSGSLAPGATFRRTFAEPGTLRYACTPHPWMEGTIVVLPAGSGEGTGPAPAPEGQEPGVPGAAPPVTGSGPPDEGGGSRTEEEGRARLRAPFAIGAGAAIVLLTALLVLPSLAGRRRARLDPATVEPAEEREPTLV